MAQRAKYLDLPDSAPKTSSVTMNLGDWLMYFLDTAIVGSGVGSVRPAGALDVLVGISGQKVQSTDSNFATNDFIAFDTVDVTADRFIMPVSLGTPDANMVGSKFNLDPAHPGSIDLTAYSTMTVFPLTGTFLVGETVTGGTSAATAVVYQVGPNALALTTITGTFAIDETITGGTSAATAKVLDLVSGGIQFQVTRVLAIVSPSTGPQVEVKAILLGQA